MSTANAPWAWVTGSSSGIGAAVAECMLNQGWVVLGIDKAPACIAHARFTPLSVDLSQGDEVSCRVKEWLQAGTPQALVHAAGVLRTAALGALNADQGALMWRLHVDAATRLADAVLPAMVKAQPQPQPQPQTGRVVLISSRISGGMPGRSQYAASKAALVSLARSWAAEVARSGITVNVVSPAATDTPMLIDPERQNSAPRLPPLGRLVQPAEVAALVAYLLSPAAAAITGQNIAICGGASLPK